MPLKNIQNEIAAILEIYDLPNIAALRRKIANLKSHEDTSKEAALLEFVVSVYEHDCDSQK